MVTVCLHLPLCRPTAVSLYVLNVLGGLRGGREGNECKNEGEEGGEESPSNMRGTNREGISGARGETTAQHRWHCALHERGHKHTNTLLPGLVTDTPAA